MTLKISMNEVLFGAKNVNNNLHISTFDWLKMREQEMRVE